MTPEQRRMVLTEFRLLREEKPLPPPKHVGDLLERQIRQLGLTERMLEDEMCEAWAEIVGEANAAQSKPVHIKRGELIVAVAQPALKYNFERFLHEEILRRLQERFGAGMVRTLRFRVGS